MTKPWIMSFNGKRIINPTWPGKPDIRSTRQIKLFFGICGIVHIGLSLAIVRISAIKLMQTNTLRISIVKDKAIKFAG